MTVRLLVTGATGRVARVLRWAWGEGGGEGLRSTGVVPVWAARRGGAPSIVAWDPCGAAPPPPCDAVLDLAGVTRGDAAALGANAAIAAAVVRAAAGRPVLFASTQAVYGATGLAAAEERKLAPRSPYGAAKAAAEAAVAGRAIVLRLGNVIGADALEAGANAGPVLFDRLPGGGGPLRSVIGPATLARTLAALARAAVAGRLPPVLNVASPGAVDLAAILVAAGVPFAWRRAPPDLLPRAVMDVQRLCALVPLPQADAGTVAAEWLAFRARRA